MASPYQAYWLKEQRRKRRQSPDAFFAKGRASFGEALEADTLIFNNFSYTDPSMHHYYDPHRQWVRSNVDIGEVTAFDPATVERSELDTLDRAADSSPLLGTDPERVLGFDFFIPEDHYQPGGVSSFVLAQIVVTGYGPPAQIHYNTSGTLRLRSLIGGSFQHTIIGAEGTFTGRWINLTIAGVWSKTAAGQTVVALDGVPAYTLADTANVGAAVSDAAKVYAKVGPYRTAVDTNPDRGLGDMWFRNLTYEAP